MICRVRRVPTPLLLLGSLVALVPQRVWAACGPTDLGACAANAQYDLWYTVASFGWWVESVLLVLAYQLDALRNWLVQVVFAGAYDALAQLTSPLIVPAALIAALLAMLAFWLVPVLGNVRLTSLRQVVLWAVLAPMLLTAGGSVVAQAEKLRVDGTTTIAQAVSSAARSSTPLFGVRGSDMTPVRPVYPANPCGPSTLRQSGASVIADHAFAFAYADAGDAFCAAARGPSRDIPDGFYLASPTGPGYAFDGTVGDLEEPQRSAFVQGMQRGAVRLWMGVLPCLLAVADSLIHCLFALALVVLWVILPFALVVVFFQQDGGAVALLARRAVVVLQLSWSTTFLLAFVAVGVATAGALANAVAFVGFATGACVFYGVGLFIAFLALKDAFTTLHDAFALITGINVGRAVNAATDVAAVGAGVAAAGLGSLVGAALLLDHATSGERGRSGNGPSGGGSGGGTTLQQTLIVLQVGDIGRAEGWHTPPDEGDGGTGWPAPEPPRLPPPPPVGGMLTIPSAGTNGSTPVNA